MIFCFLPQMWFRRGIILYLRVSFTWLLCFYIAGVLIKCLTSFSIINNTKLILAVNKNNSSDTYQYRFIHGIRFLSMVWIALGHSYGTVTDNMCKYSEEFVFWARSDTAQTAPLVETTAKVGLPWQWFRGSLRVFKFRECFFFVFLPCTISQNAKIRSSCKGYLLWQMKISKSHFREECERYR